MPAHTTQQLCPEGAMHTCPDVSKTPHTSISGHATISSSSRISLSTPERPLSACPPLRGSAVYSEGSKGIREDMKDRILQTASPKLLAPVTRQTVRPSHSQRRILGHGWGKKGLIGSKKSDVRVCGLHFHSDSCPCQAFSPVISGLSPASFSPLNRIVQDLGE